MNKHIGIIICLFTLLLLVSCGNQSGKKTSSTTAKRTVTISPKLLAELESQFLIFRNLSIPPFHLDVEANVYIPTAQDKVSDSLKFLLPLKRAGELKTLRKKNMAMMMYVADAGFAQVYGCPVEEYRDVIKRLSEETNTVEDFTVSSRQHVNMNGIDAQTVFWQWFKGRFDKEVENGTLNMLFERSLALLLENVYLFSQDPDKILANISNSDAAAVTKKIEILIAGIEKLHTVYPDMKELVKKLQPLKELNASNKKDLIEQVKVLTPQIQEVRNSLLNG